MRIRKLMAEVWKDDSGAALVEYTVLIGLVTVGILTIIISISGWMAARWTTVDGALNGG